MSSLLRYQIKMTLANLIARVIFIICGMKFNYYFGVLRLLYYVCI